MKIIKRLISVVLVIALVFGCTLIAAFKLYPVKYAEAIDEYSKAYGVDKYLILSIIKAESNFDNGAVSHKKASGLMQITKGTADWLSGMLEINGFNYERDIRNPELNIKMGSFYISYLKDLYDESLDCALASYNAGPNNVNKWLLNKEYSKDGKTLDKIPFPETERYINKVKTNYKIYKLLYKEAVDEK